MEHLISLTEHLISLIQTILQSISYILSLPLWQGISALAGIAGIIIGIKSLRDPRSNLTTKPNPNTSAFPNKKKNSASAQLPLINPKFLILSVEQEHSTHHNN